MSLDNSVLASYVAAISVYNMTALNEYCKPEIDNVRQGARRLSTFHSHSMVAARTAIIVFHVCSIINANTLQTVHYIAIHNESVMEMLADSQYESMFSSTALVS